MKNLKDTAGVLVVAASLFFFVSSTVSAAVPSADPERGCPATGGATPAAGAPPSVAGKKAHEVVRMGAGGTIEHRCIPTTDGETPRKVYCDIEGRCRPVTEADMRRVGDLVTAYGTPGSLPDPNLTEVRTGAGATPPNAHTIPASDFMYRALGGDERGVGVDRFSEILFAESQVGWGRQVDSFDEATLAANVLDRALDTSTRITRDEETLASIAEGSLHLDRSRAEGGFLAPRIAPADPVEYYLDRYPVVPLDESGRPLIGPLVQPPAPPPRIEGYTEQELLAPPAEGWYDTRPPRVIDASLGAPVQTQSVFRAALDRFYSTSGSFYRGIQNSFNSFWDRWI
ncbi:MAG: hypothetical protein AAB421_01520 [Patescibacteria group bacterium]